MRTGVILKDKYQTVLSLVLAEDGLKRLLNGFLRTDTIVFDTMNRGTELIEKLQSATESDWNVQQTDDSRYAILSPAESNSFDLQIGPRYDGRLAVVATHWRDFGSVGAVPYPVEYRRVETVADTVEGVSEIIRKYCESQHWSVKPVGDTVPADDVGEYLVDNGAAFVAAPENLLAYGIFRLLWTTPRENDGSVIREYLQGIDAVTVDGRPLPFAGSSEISPDSAHTGARVPLYASDRVFSTTDAIESDEGLAKLREYDFSASPKSTLAIDPQTTSLESLLEQLVECGAVAIALEKEVSRPENLTFSVHIPPEEGYNIVAEYPFVEFDDSELDVDWVCQMDGPHFSFRVPIYASEDIRGLESVSLPEGLTNLRKFISGDTDADHDVGDEL